MSEKDYYNYLLGVGIFLCCVC